MRALGLLAWIVTDNATWVLLHFAAFPGSDMTYRLLWLFDPVIITVEALLTASTYGKFLGLSTWHCALFRALSLQLLDSNSEHITFTCVDSSCELGIVGIVVVIVATPHIIYSQLQA